jgi:hypothetical protein
MTGGADWIAELCQSGSARAPNGFHRTEPSTAPGVGGVAGRARFDTGRPPGDVDRKDTTA